MSPSLFPKHDKLKITSIDWAPKTNRIVTCSQDRSVYVWNQATDPVTGSVAWKPTLVPLRVNRSATFVRWSPNEQKFAVAVSARAIAVCSYDDESDEWVARHFDGSTRTALSLDWHPNSVLIATGSSDQKARVRSTYLEGDEK
jgi:actin related protein 2/3 complex subunit 1A/1B